MSHKLSEKTSNWLLTHGYNTEDFNQRGNNGDTALMKATREGTSAIAKELIDAGADLNIRNNDGNNALWFACFGNHYNLDDETKEFLRTDKDVLYAMAIGI